MTSSVNNMVQKAANGDVEAFARLVRNYSGLVYRVAMRVLGPQDAQDASQEVWIRVWRNLKRFRGDSAFSTWLYKITLNTCLNARRRGQTREALEFDDEFPYPMIPISPGDEYDPETAALNEERRAEIFRALEQVRAEHRAALVLRHMEGLSYREVAQILDVPDGTVKGWVSRGRAALLVALSNGGPGDESLDSTGGAS